MHSNKVSIRMVSFRPNGRYVFVYLDASKTTAHINPKQLHILIQNNGINHLGEQIISEQWIASLFGETEKVNTCPMYKSCNTWGVLGGGWGYSYQTWLPPIPKTMVAIGKYGQYIFVAKNSNTVIVITSADFPRGLGEKPLLMQLFRAAAES